jgi:hypothetical protein
MATRPPDWQHGASCGRCGFAHAICSFRAGSLYCVDVGCANPHHRAAPDGYVPAREAT